LKGNNCTHAHYHFVHNSHTSFCVHIFIRDGFVVEFNFEVFIWLSNFGIFVNSLKRWCLFCCPCDLRVCDYTTNP